MCPPASENFSATIRHRVPLRAVQPCGCWPKLHESVVQPLPHHHLPRNWALLCATLSQFGCSALVQLDTMVGSGGTQNSSGAADSAAVGPTNASAVALVTGQQMPAALAVDQHNVYWINFGTYVSLGEKDSEWTGGQVMKCAIEGCQNNPTVLTSDRMRVNPIAGEGFATDGTNVYWSDNGSVNDAGYYGDPGGLLSCSIDGCGNAPLQVAAGNSDAIAVDGVNVYWANNSDWGVYACPMSGCGSAPTRLWSGNSYPITGLAIGYGEVYWVLAAGTMNPMTCSPYGCGDSPSVLSENVVGAALRQIALDTENVYFLDGNPYDTTNPTNAGKVFKCSISGCAEATVLADQLNSPLSIATDGTNVYWSEFEVSGATGEGSIRKCPVDGCGNVPITVVSNVNGPGPIAVDSQNLYWVETGQGSGDGRIWMAPEMSGHGSTCGHRGRGIPRGNPNR